MNSVPYQPRGNKVKIGAFVLTTFFLSFPLQECQEFFRLLAVCHTVMVESNSGKNYWFFWSRESYTLSCRHISQAGFFHSDTFFQRWGEGRGGEGEEGGRLSSVRRFSLCVLLSTWAELFEGRLTRPGFCFLLFKSIFRDNFLYYF